MSLDSQLFYGKMMEMCYSSHFISGYEREGIYEKRERHKGNTIGEIEVVSQVKHRVSWPNYYGADTIYNLNIENEWSLSYHRGNRFF